VASGQIVGDPFVWRRCPSQPRLQPKTVRAQRQNSGRTGGYFATATHDRTRQGTHATVPSAATTKFLVLAIWVLCTRTAGGGGKLSLATHPANTRRPLSQGLGSQSNLVMAFKAHDRRPTFNQFLDEFPTPVTAVRGSIEHAHRAHPIASVSGLGRYRSIANAMSDIASPRLAILSVQSTAEPLASQFWACALR
jgi:hypothetical protein